MHREQRPFGVIGVFLVLLGAGVILDGDRMWSGYTLIIAGAASLLAAWICWPPEAGLRE